MNIKFSPPDITEKEINEVIDALKSGWITTGPKTKKFEKMIASYCNTSSAVCLNSATACLELSLRILGIGEGDEVITSAYTYTASASVIQHIGAKIVLVDTMLNSYQMDLNLVEKAITDKTKAIICVDIAGVPCDYDNIFKLVDSKRKQFKANNKIQEAIGRIAVVADGAHSLGAKYKGQKSGNIADFTSFSFHAVKNLTTAEGGAATWKDIPGIDNSYIYNEYMLWSLHGQNKDALSKTQIGSWEYDINRLGYKCNMTDIMASIGIAQLNRYNGLLQRRHEIIDMYINGLKSANLDIIKHKDDNFISSGHLFLTRVNNINETKRNEIIVKMAEQGIATNVHYKPLPMFTAYKNIGFNIEDYKNAYNQYKNEITLPLHTLLTNEEIEYIIENYLKVLNN